MFIFEFQEGIWSPMYSILHYHTFLALTCSQF
jgi:hypothetical protein